MQDLLQDLLNGIARFQHEVFADYRDLFLELENGQHPSTLFIACSDSRIDPHLIMQTYPGQLFVLRTAGNLIPPYEAVRGAEAATIEYAVKALHVQHIIVCGHSKCGAIKALLDPDCLSELPAVREYLKYAELTRSIFHKRYSDVEDPVERWVRAVEINVLVQLENLRHHPAVAQALHDGAMTLHGWVYKFQTGEFSAFRPDEGTFVPLDTAQFGYAV